MNATRHQGAGGAIGRRIVRLTLLLLTVHTMLGMSSASCQDDWWRTTSIQGLSSRIVFPDVADVPLDQARRILNALEEERDLRGLPTDAHLPDTITISLALEMQPGLDGRSIGRSATVIVPLRQSLSWEEAKLRRVLRHEIAHLALADYLGHRELPMWFTEGFAEWASGGLTREGHVRIEIELQRRSTTRAGEMPPRLEDAWEDLPRRLAYDFFASFFEFLEVSRPSLLSSGELLRKVRLYGLHSALSAVFGRELGELESAWHQWLKDHLLPKAGSEQFLVPT